MTRFWRWVNRTPPLLDWHAIDHTCIRPHAHRGGLPS